MYSAVRAANMSGLVGRQGFSIHLRNAYSEMRAYPADNAFLISAQALVMSPCWWPSSSVRQEVATELSAKRLELLKEAVPTVARVAVLWNAADPAMTLRYREIRTAAETMHVEILPVGVQEPED